MKVTHEDAKKLHEQMNFCYEVYNTNKNLCDFCRNEYLKLAKHFSDFEFYVKECQKQKSELEKKDIEIDILMRKKETLRDEVAELQAEIERLNAIAEMPNEGFFNLLCGALVYTKTLKEYNNFRKMVKAEAIKEFAERLKENEIDIDVSYGFGREHYTKAVATIVIDNLVKELTEVIEDA